MASQSDLTSLSLGRSTALRYMARQPILDPRGRVYGYELLSRIIEENSFDGETDLATSTMIDNSVIFGLEDLTGGLPAFVNCTNETLTGGQVGVLPPTIAVLEILGSQDPVPGLVDACRELKAQGFRLALDDFIWTPSMEPLVLLADYIKIDLMVSSRDQRLETLARLHGRSVALVAEKVDTQEDYERSRAEGFTLFQGYYFCKPVIVTKRKIPANRLNHLKLLQELQEEPLNLHTICELIKTDTSITYRLLRLANSPAYATRREAHSVLEALLIVGDDVFRRMVTLAIATEFNAGKTPEILRLALVRARFCEQASRICSLDADEQYLLGMFSMLPAMLGTSMDQAIAPLPLGQPIREALLGIPGKGRILLDWMEGNEYGDWKRCDRVALLNNLNQNSLHRCLREAIRWTELILSAA